MVKNHQNDLPAWAEACKLASFIGATIISHVAEHIFSLLEDLFSYKQNFSLEDYYLSVYYALIL